MHVILYVVAASLSFFTAILHTATTVLYGIQFLFSHFLLAPFIRILTRIPTRIPSRIPIKFPYLFLFCQLFILYIHSQYVLTCLHYITSFLSLLLIYLFSSLSISFYYLHFIIILFIPYSLFLFYLSPSFFFQLFRFSLPDLFHFHLFHFHRSNHLTSPFHCSVQILQGAKRFFVAQTRRCTPSNCHRWRWFVYKLISLYNF